MAIDPKTGRSAKTVLWFSAIIIGFGLFGAVGDYIRLSELATLDQLYLLLITLGVIAFSAAGLLLISRMPNSNLWRVYNILSWVILIGLLVAYSSTPRENEETSRLVSFGLNLMYSGVAATIFYRFWKAGKTVASR